MKCFFFFFFVSDALTHADELKREVNEKVAVSISDTVCCVLVFI